MMHGQKNIKKNCCVLSCLRQWSSWNIRLQIMTSQDLLVVKDVTSHPRSY